MHHKHSSVAVIAGKKRECKYFKSLSSLKVRSGYVSTTGGPPVGVCYVLYVRKHQAWHLDINRKIAVRKGQ